MLRRWRAKQRKLVDVFGALQRPSNSLSVAAAARLYELPYQFVQKRWKRWLAADRLGDQSARDAALQHHGGGHNRAFLPDDENALANHLAADYSVVTPAIVRSVAVQFHALQERKKGTHRFLRSKIHPPFAASSCFVAGFRQRQEIPLRATRLLREPTADASKRDRWRDGFDFVVAVRQAVMDFGADMVWNADEVSSKRSHTSTFCSSGSSDSARSSEPRGHGFNSRATLTFCASFLPSFVPQVPVHIIQQPSHALGKRGVSDYANISTKYLHGSYLTTLPCISTAGEKLPLTAVLKGTTPLCLRKIEQNASEVVKRVRLFYTAKGKTTSDFMLDWLHQVFLERTWFQPCALILDDYGAHWTKEVQIHAQALNIRLIHVPPGMTPECQPLDVKYNGPMLQKRKHFWLKRRTDNPFQHDSWQSAVELAQLAYADMSAEAGRNAFAAASLIDE